MQTLRLDMTQDYLPVVDRTVQVLADGQAVAMPTDTLYGLTCNALDVRAVGRVFDIKHRSYVKALPMLVKDLGWARELAYIDPEHERLLDALWPGKVTFVFLRRDMVPAMLCGGGQTVGIRVPRDEFVQSVLQHLGYPIAATSANLSGQESARDGAQVIDTFAASMPQPQLIVDAGILELSAPSTVVDLSGRQPRILRQGAVRADKILSLL